MKEYTEEEILQHAEEYLEYGDLLDSVLETVDGCSVEPDGHCSHGYASPLIVLGLI